MVNKWKHSKNSRKGVEKRWDKKQNKQERMRNAREAGMVKKSQQQQESDNEQNNSANEDTGDDIPTQQCSSSRTTRHEQCRQRIQRAELELRDAQQQLTEIKRQHAATVEELQQAQHQIEEQQHRAAQLQEDKQQLQHAHTAATEELQRAQQRIEHQQRRTEEQQREIDRLRFELRQCNIGIQALQQHNVHLMQRNNELDDQLAQLLRRGRPPTPFSEKSARSQRRNIDELADLTSVDDIPVELFLTGDLILRFLRITPDDFMGLELVRPCLDKLPKLIALELDLQNLSLEFLQLSGVFRCSPFRDLVHLGLYLDYDHLENYEPIGLLPTVAPKLRSLNLDAALSLEQSHGAGSELLKLAQNGILEFLHVPFASFTVEMLDQFIRQCPNLHFLGARIYQKEQLHQVTELQHVVANQWREGTRKHLPLRIWIYGHPDLLDREYSQRVKSIISWQDPFLVIQLVHFGFGPPNPVLDAMFRAEVFIESDNGGTPSFVKKHYSKKTY